MNDDVLKKYAELICKVGVNIQKGQEVVIRSNVNDEYFTKYVVEEAYNCGACEVFVDWTSEEVSRLNYNMANMEKYKNPKSYEIERMKYRANTLPAMIYLESDDPDFLSTVNQQNVMDVTRSVGKVMKPIRDTMENKYQWTIVALPSEKWAHKLFPSLSISDAVEKLWDVILKCARCDSIDPINAWKLHNKNIKDKCDILNSLNIKELHYESSNGTNFKVGLLKDLLFCGGESMTISGIHHNPNMPTEECFTSPDKHTMEGVVYATKPLSLEGNVIKDFGFRFEKGKVVEILTKNEKDKELLNTWINMDEGASYLGEVALVPYDSPVNKSGILFFNTLFDENACCHLALGEGFEDCIKDFDKLTDEQLKSYGLNDSIIHTDFMIGSSDLTITATTTSNKTIQIFKNGTWAI